MAKPTRLSICDAFGYNSLYMVPWGSERFIYELSNAAIGKELAINSCCPLLLAGSSGAWRV
jgi:hypothetical protein